MGNTRNPDSLIMRAIKKTTIPSLDPDVCWGWNGGVDKNGYGIFSFYDYDKKVVYSYRVHRWMWAQLHGEIENKLHILHRCDNPPCIRPSHLFPGSNKLNQVDCVMKGRNPKTKLTYEQVEAIRRRRAQGESIKSIQKDIIISDSTICQVANDQAWRESIILQLPDAIVRR